MSEGPYKLSKGWRWVRLGEICDKPQYGYTQSASQDPIGPKFLRITDITSGVIDWDSVPYCHADRHVLEKYRLTKGDLLFARSGSVGSTILIRESPPYDAIFASYLIRVRINQYIALPEFIEIFTKSPFGQAQLIPQGAAQKNINAKRIQQLLIPLPPLEEQRRIVARIEELMSRVREARRLQEETLKDADRLWQSVLAEVFPKPNSLLPSGWRWVRLGEVCETTSGGTPSRKKPEYFGGNIPWVKSGELNDSIIVDTEEKITELGLKNSNAKLFPKGTLLIAMYGATVGKLGILGCSAATNQAICALFPNKSTLDKMFLFYFFLFKRKELMAQSFGEAQPNISQTVIRKTEIPLPPLSEQRRIVAYLDELQAKITALKKYQQQTTAELNLLEQATLDKAFRGEL